MAEDPMNCAACGAVSTGAGRCGACGAVMPLPGEELVHDHPVSVALPLDRRGPRDGGPQAPAPAALGRDLGLDRREEPRPPHHSPLDPVRPMAEAAAHLLRHVAASPLFRDEPAVGAEPPAARVPVFLREEPGPAPRPAVAPASSAARIAAFPDEPAAGPAPLRAAAEEVSFFDDEPIDVETPFEPAESAEGTHPAAPVPPLFDDMPAAVEVPDRAAALSALFGDEPSAAPSGDPGLPEDAWRALEADVPEDELSDEILMPPAAPAWRRLVAWTIDGVLLVGVPLAALAAATRGTAGEDGVALRFVDLLRDHGAVQAAAVALAALTGFVYLTLSSALGGRTPGAALAGLGVVHCASGAPPTLGRAALRAALAVAGTFACFLGPLWALFDDRGQALHDKLAGTVVMVDR